MSEKFEHLNKNIITCMKTKERFYLSAYKILKSEIQAESKDLMEDITDEMVIRVAKRLAKQMEKSLAIASDDKNITLKKVCEQYIPQQVTDKDIYQYLMTLTYVEPPTMQKDMGRLMRILKQAFGDSLDGGVASKAVRDFISDFGRL